MKDLEDQSFGGGEEMENASAEDDFNFEKWDIHFHALTPNDVEQLEFKNPKVAYAFYNEFSRNHGFSVRKSKTVKNKNGKIVRYTFMCSRQGFQDKKWLKRAD